jgi:hypothetical protein
MELATRRLIWFAVTDQPDGGWVAQQARNVSWELNELGVQARILVHDHDAKYGGGSDLVFKAEGIEVITTPIAAPKANSHMERQIGSTRRECLDWILILNRRHLERVLDDWFELQRSSSPPSPSAAASDRALRSGGDGRRGDLLGTTWRVVARVRPPAPFGRCLNPDLPCG